MDRIVDEETFVMFCMDKISDENASGADQTYALECCTNWYRNGIRMDFDNIDFNEITK